jgi:AraC-like DNA-binding protein
MCKYFLLFVQILTLLIWSEGVVPKAFWVAPAEYEILRDSPVRLAVEPASGKEKIAKVLFYASYTDSQNRFVDRLQIGEVSSFPYEMFWDCSHLPDHAITNLCFYASVIDNAGVVDTILSLPNGSESHRWRRFVLCLDTVLSRDTLVSSVTHLSYKIDGLLQDWVNTDSFVCFKGDNRVVVRSSWDESHLYFGIQVQDTLLVSHYTIDSGQVTNVVEEDDLELFLDLKVERGYFMNRSCPQFVFAPSGLVYQVVRDTVDAGINLRPLLQHQIVLQGQPNDDIADTGYILECAIPWTTLGLEQKPSHSLGFAVVNVDNDGTGNTLSASYWPPKLIPSVLTMPKKWGVLAFNKTSHFRFGWFIPLFLLAAGVGCYFFLRASFKKAAAVPQKEMTFIKEEIRKAQEFIRLHYKEMELNREKVAQQVGLSPEYFSTLFNKESGTSFSEFVNGLRLAEAERLLKETDTRISEIALEAGFSGLDHFDRTFKKARSMSPKEFRRQHFHRF